MSVESSKEQFTFQAEISRLLHLLSESLYQNREITIRELVSNASDALDKLRHQSLTNSAIKADDLQISIEPDKEGNVLIIRDNGIGIDTKYRDQIFTPFLRLHTRAEYEGTGIGLSICKKYVERHGGQLNVQSSCGNGAEFQFTIPV